MIVGHLLALNTTQYAWLGIYPQVYLWGWGAAGLVVGIVVRLARSGGRT